MKADLSIIVTSYNKTPQQIEECFQSIRDQTVRPREVILVDDGSTSPRAHADAISILLPKNNGVAVARDVGVRMSLGSLLLFVDADDKLAPDFIEQCGKEIANCDISYPNVVLFGDIEINTSAPSPKELNPEDLMNRSCKIVVTSMMHRHVYNKLGGFQDLPVYEDWDFWIRAMYCGYKFRQANTLLWYRQSPKSRNQISNEIRLDTYNRITAPYRVEEGRICLKQTG